jgi:hypothetical protein
MAKDKKSMAKDSVIAKLAKVAAKFRVRATRPSILDKRFSGDPWIISGKEGEFLLCLGDYGLANIQGSDLDLPALNGLLDRVRHCKPRQR